MTKQHRPLRSNSPLAIALRARETLSHPDQWRTGFRYKDGKMCLTGHILQAMGAKKRCDSGNMYNSNYTNSNYTNFDVTPEEETTLEEILQKLGFQSAADAEGRNDQLGDHKKVLERYDYGLLNWVDEEELV